MRAGRLRRTRSRTSKSKRGADKQNKAMRCAMPHDDATTQFESTHSLLLSSLRYWQVELDLIEQPIAAVRSLCDSYVRYRNSLSTRSTASSVHVARSGQL